MLSINKYPRTPHIQGSRCQAGDENLANVPFSALKDKYVIIEEKVDGANSGISFAGDGQLLLQSRGHYLTGGYRERHFNLFKQWAYTHQQDFWQALGSRYILYGEWMYAKHTVFYNALPDYFLEYDLFDRELNVFVSTAVRRQILAGLPVHSVPILFEGSIRSYDKMVALLDRSHFITAGHLEDLAAVCRKYDIDVDLTLAQTNPSNLMEGIYIKVETDELTIDRYKYVRADFLNTILDSGTHWIDRPIVPNQLAG
jgi:hypothetical protein